MRRTAAVVVSVAVLSAAWAASAAAAGSPRDQRAANAGLLQLQDFPAGWTASPNTSNDNGSTRKALARVAVCKPFLPLLGTARAGSRANGKSTFQFNGLNMSNSVVVYPTLASANRTFAASQSAAFRTCTEQLLRRGLTQQLRQQGQASAVANLTVTVQLLSPGLSVGDVQSAVTATVTLPVSGTTTRLYIEDVFVRTGRAVDSFAYENDSAPISDTVPSAITASVTRLETALRS